MSSPISNLPMMIGQPLSIYFYEIPKISEKNNTYKQNIFALKSEARMEKFYEDLRKTKELFQIQNPNTLFEKLEVNQTNGESYRNKLIKNDQDFSKKLDDLGTNNLFAAKTRKKIMDYSNFNPILHNSQEILNASEKKIEIFKIKTNKLLENISYAGKPNEYGEFSMPRF